MTSMARWYGAPTSVARPVGEYVWVDYIDAADVSDDKLLIVDGLSGARVAVDHGSWNGLVEAIEYFGAGHCDRPDCYGVDPNQVESLAALIREVDGDHSMGAAQLAEALMARGVSGPTRAVRT